MQRTLTIEYGDEILLGLGLSPDEFSTEARFLLAAKLYELGRITSGQAATLAHKGRVEFFLDLPRAGVAVSNLQPEDMESDLDFGWRSAFGQARPHEVAEVARILAEELGRIDPDAW